MSTLTTNGVVRDEAGVGALVVPRYAYHLQAELCEGLAVGCVLGPRPLDAHRVAERVGGDAAGVPVPRLTDEGALPLQVVTHG